METTENFDMTGADPGVVLTTEAQGFLREAGKWANFLGIVGFVLTGLIVIIALFAGTVLATLSGSFPGGAVAGAGMGGVITVFYLLFAAIYFFFSLYLYQFGSQIKKGLMFADSLQVTTALGKLKSFFKLWAILTIVLISLYVLVIIIAVIFGMSAGSMMNR